MLVALNCFVRNSLESTNIMVCKSFQVHASFQKRRVFHFQTILHYSYISFFVFVSICVTLMRPELCLLREPFYLTISPAFYQLLTRRHNLSQILCVNRDGSDGISALYVQMCRIKGLLSMGKGKDMILWVFKLLTNEQALMFFALRKHLKLFVDDTVNPF